ncbi:hypothetical protein C4G51_RS18680 [Vibrio parahaemolyticus]|nr:hypothetical protein [Vibrio parahaemolyticus]
MEDENEVCSYCNGTGSNKANWQDLNENDELQMEAIECPNCGGSGLEPR